MFIRSTTWTYRLTYKSKNVRPLVTKSANDRWLSTNVWRNVWEFLKKRLSFPPVEESSAFPYRSEESLASVRRGWTMTVAARDEFKPNVGRTAAQMDRLCGVSQLSSSNGAGGPANAARIVPPPAVRSFGIGHVWGADRSQTSETRPTTGLVDFTTFRNGRMVQEIFVISGFIFKTVIVIFMYTFFFLWLRKRDFYNFSMCC